MTLSVTIYFPAHCVTHRAGVTSTSTQALWGPVGCGPVPFAVTAFATLIRAGVKCESARYGAR